MLISNLLIVSMVPKLKGRKFYLNILFCLICKINTLKWMQNTLKLYNTLYMQYVATSLVPLNSLVSMDLSMQRTWVQFPGKTFTNQMHCNTEYCKYWNNWILQSNNTTRCWKQQLPLRASPLLETGRHVHWTSLKRHMPCVFTKVSIKNTMQSDDVLTGSNTQVGCAIQTMLSFY